jgi:hypothetical protein
MTDPAALRALAARVETEEPTDALNEDVARAFEWLYQDGHDSPWVCPDYAHDYHDEPPPFLTDLTVAASLMPVGWTIVICEYSERFHVDAVTINGAISVEGSAPTEPRARVAAAIRAMAAEMEARE